MSILKKRARSVAIHGSLGAAAFLVVTAGLAGVHVFSSSQGGSSPTPSVSGVVPTIKIGVVPTIDQPSDISLPVDRFRGSETARASTTAAINAYTATCASKFGVQFKTPIAEDGYDALSTYYGLFGLVDATAAQRWGYHPGTTPSSPSEATDALSPAAEQAVIAKSPDYLAVVFGQGSATARSEAQVPAGGCLGEARSRIGSSVDDDLLIDDAVNYGLDQSDADIRVADATAEWSECMRASGYSYGSPQDANNDSRWSTDSTSPAEITAAVADVRCKTSTNLTGVRVAVASAWVNRFIAAHNTEFGAIQAHHAAALKNALEVLSIQS